MPEYYAYTPAKAAEILGVKRSYVYLLLGKLDPETGRTVLEKFTPPNIDGEIRLYITAESVERFKQQREE